MKKIGFFVNVVLLAELLVSCNGLSVNSKESAIADTVVIETLMRGDTTSFKMSDGGICKVFANAEIQYPQTYNDKATTHKLQQIFAKEILDVEDSENIEAALTQFLANVISDYGAEDAIEDSEKDEHVNVYRFSSNIEVRVISNKNDIVSFCKEETTKKNGSVTMKTHTYYNIDYKALEYIDLNKVVGDAHIDDVTKLLKEQLIANLKVKSESELIELGYFNLDNLTANSNFYITKEGITWCYSTYEIACFSVGETQITLSWEKLMPYINEQSSVLQLKED